MPDRTLTPEQVADFERRAAEGERPVLEWYPGTDDDPVLNLAGVDVEMVYGYRRPSEKRHYVTSACGPDFSSLAAAQLAAEHLLREATRPLHQAELADLNKAWPAILDARSSAIDRALGLHDAITEDQVAAIAAKDARIAELEAKVQDLMRYNEL